MVSVENQVSSLREAREEFMLKMQIAVSSIRDYRISDYAQDDYLRLRRMTASYVSALEKFLLDDLAED